MWRVAVIVGSCQEAGGLAPAPPTLPSSDRAALGLAIQRFGGQVQAYCLRDDAEALRYALAAGAASAIRLPDVATLDFDVVLVGSGGAAPWGDLLLALLAEQKQCAMVFEVLDVAPSPDGLMVRRDLGRGSREILTLSGPAVLGIAEAAPQLLYVSRYRRQAVRTALPGLHAGQVEDPLAAVSGPWEPARPRLKTGDLAAKTTGSASARLQALLGLSADAPSAEARAHIVIADAATCARHLLRFLRHHGMVAAAMPPSSAPAARAADTASDTQSPVTSVWTPHLRAPRPLQGERRGMERWPRPLHLDAKPSQQATGGTPLRTPRPVGQAAPQRLRGPRPLDTEGNSPGVPVR